MSDERCWECNPDQPPSAFVQLCAPHALTQNWRRTREIVIRMGWMEWRQPTTEIIK